MLTQRLSQVRSILAAMDERLQRIAGPFEIITTASLFRAGISQSQIKSLCHNQHITRIREGAFKIGCSNPTRLQELAAVQALVPASVISHFDAGSIWELPYNYGLGLIEVSIQGPRRVRMSGVWCHQTRHNKDDVVNYQGLRVTSPARTLFDMSFVLSVGQLGQNYQDLQFRKMITFDEIRRVSKSLGPARWRRTAHVNKIVKERAVAGGKTQSNEERLFYETVVQGRLPKPIAQHPVTTDIGVIHPDFAYPAPKIAMEIDVHPSHFTPEGIQRDQERTAALERAGWLVLRFKSGDALTIINEVSAALVSRSGRSAPVAA